MSTNASSTAFVVISTFVSALQAIPELSDVQILYGDTAHAERENLIIPGDIHWTDESWAALGARSREEQYTFDGYCQVRRPGDSQQDANERVGQLVAYVESTLRSMAANGGMGFSSALAQAFPAPQKAQVTNVQFKPEKLLGWPSDEGERAQMSFLVQITARI